jgi:hypothetical protein
VLGEKRDGDRFCHTEGEPAAPAGDRNPLFDAEIAEGRRDRREDVARLSKGRRGGLPGRKRADVMGHVGLMLYWRRHCDCGRCVGFVDQDLVAALRDHDELAGVAEAIA